jgi:hypothetical protein
MWTCSGTIKSHFTWLSDIHLAVRQASSEAICVMAKTSDETRRHLFPVLVLQLDGPPPAAIDQIALGVYDSIRSGGNVLNLLY